MEWLPGSTVAPVRSAIARCAGGGIIRSSVTTRYQLGLIRHAASLIIPPRAFTPQGTWESAMNAARPAGRSPANEAWNLSRSSNRKPSRGGRIGGCGPSAGKPAKRVDRLALVRREGRDAHQGLANKQIGERLYLSHRTVATHLYQIFPKLGVTSRAALRDALSGSEDRDEPDR
jgi:hypothetical protein